MNVLLSCAGRRNYLAGYFQAALAGRGEVFVVDASDEAPAMIEAGSRGTLVPPLSDPGYFDALLKVCKDRKIGLLLSLNDFELSALSRQAGRFRDAGVIPVISEPDFVDLCFDKWATFEKLSSLGIPVPKTVLGAENAKSLRYPLIVKPRWGTGSVGVELVQDEAQLQAASAWLKRKLKGSAVAGQETQLLVQEAVKGQEYGVDLIHDLDRRHRAVITKKKLAMRAGETDRAVVEPCEPIAALAKKLGEALKPRGLVDCDAFMTEAGPMILELNPRFGGGYPFSHAAGADVPAALLAWAEGKDAKPEWLRAKPGVLSAKCDRLVSRTR